MAGTAVEIRRREFNVEETPAYKAGLQAGIAAEAPIRDIVDVLLLPLKPSPEIAFPKPRRRFPLLRNYKRTNGIPTQGSRDQGMRFIDALNWASGYSRGIDNYMHEHSPFDTERSFLYPQLLISATEFDACSAGLSRGAPPISTDRAKRDSKQEVSARRVKHRNEISISLPADVPRGYFIGFAVGITRDFGLPIDFTGIPTDSNSYMAYLGGFAGLGRGELSPETEASYKLGLNLGTIARAQGLQKSY